MLIYLHGFNSSPDSRKATFLREFMAERGLASQIACPALPPYPAEAITLIEHEIARVDRGGAVPLTFIGSSLGGFYATYLAEKHDARAVLVNPAVYPQRDLGAYLGMNQNLYTGARYELTAEHLRQLEALVVATVHPERYLLLVETDDEVLDYRQAVTRYAGARQVVVAGGDHSFRSFAAQLPLIFEFAGLPWHA